MVALIIAISVFIIACLSIVVAVYFILTLLSVRRCADNLTELTLDIREDLPQIREKAINIITNSDEMVKKVHNTLEGSNIKNRIISPIVTVFSIVAGIKAGTDVILKILSRR
ncbi:MAG: DUF948 domain-containing protein [bacterium]|nr:DUF948 domain-containing protein [bacterium]